MAYRVVITPLATSDLEEYAERISLDSPKRAQEWLRGAWSIIFSLREMPNRFSVCEESPIAGKEIRDVVHFSHRIVFSVNESEQVVDVLRVWHTARRSISYEDVPVN